MNTNHPRITTTNTRMPALFVIAIPFVDGTVENKRVLITGPTSGVGKEIATGLFRHAEPERVKELAQYSGGRTPAEGADTATWLASDPELDGVTNKFYQDREELECEFQNKRDEEKLWKICEGFVNRN